MRAERAGLKKKMSAERSSRAPIGSKRRHCSYRTVIDALQTAPGLPGEKLRASGRCLQIVCSLANALEPCKRARLAGNRKDERQCRRPGIAASSHRRGGSAPEDASPESIPEGRPPSWATVLPRMARSPLPLGSPPVRPPSLISLEPRGSEIKNTSAPCASSRSGGVR